jgi:outer membrane receptor protein involved in Fe transport
VPESSLGADLVVTATRQSQLLSKVPISISAYSQKSLDVQGIRNVDDVTRSTPGLSISRVGFGTKASVSIRGINSSIGAGTVGVYVDDTPIQIRSVGYSSTNLYPQLFDLERVEVLRGPQGTLFGAGSQGGTIRFITPSPNMSDWHSYIRAEAGAIDGGSPTYEAGAAIGGPIIEDKIGFRASVDYRHDGGWIDRVVTDPVAANRGQFGFTSVADKNANYQNSLVARGAIAFRPSENLTITPSVLYQNTRLNDLNTFWIAESDPDESEYRSGQSLQQPDHDRYVLPAIKLEYNGPGFDLISNTSWFSRKQTAIDDYGNLIAGIFAGANNVFVKRDGTPFLPDYRAYASMDNTYRNFVQELRIQSQDPQAPLTWVFGLFYNNLRQRAYEDLTDPQFGAVIQNQFGLTLRQFSGLDLIDGRYTLIADARTRDRQLAAYGEVSYEVLEGLRARVGLRWSRNKFESQNFATGAFVSSTSNDSNSTTEKPLTPKFSVEWQANPDHLFYATAAKGFRVGGTNSPVLSRACAAELSSRGYTNGSPLVYESDSLWSYEAGAKSKLFGGNTQVQASVYHIKWKNIQQNVYLNSCGVQFTDNLGQVESNGFDLQLNQRLGALNINLAAGYTRSRYAVSQFRPGQSVPQIREGNALETRPWTVSAGAQYDLTLLERNSYVRADYTYRGGKALGPGQDVSTTSYNPNSLPPATQTQLNLRAGVLFGQLDLSLFANNVTNSHPRLLHYREGADPMFRQTTLTPRTIGVTASYRY